MRLADLPWTGIRLEGAVVLLPVGATEAHGPHLPASTDVIIAEAMAREAAARLAAKGVQALVLPPIAYSVAEWASGFPGTVSIRPETAATVLVDIARSLARQKVKVLGLANAHLEPAHIASLQVAVKRIQDEGLLTVVFPDVTRHGLSKRLTEEFRSGACHAGQYEGSIVMAERPDLVKEEVRKALPPNPVSLVDAIRAGKRTFEEAGGKDAYFGDPARATAEEGRRTVQTLGAILEEAVSLGLLEVPETAAKGLRPAGKPMSTRSFNNLLFGAIPAVATALVAWLTARFDVEGLLKTYARAKPVQGWPAHLFEPPAMLGAAILLSFIPAWAVIRLGVPRRLVLGIWTFLLPAVLLCLWIAGHLLVSG